MQYKIKFQAILITMILLASLLTTQTLLAAQNNKDKHWATSYALEANGQYEQAAALMVSEMENGEASELALLRYGWLNYLQGNYNDSIRSYNRALARNNRSIDARLGMTLPLLAQKRWQEARRHLNQIIALSPYHYTAHIRLMICEEGLRQWQTLQTHTQKIAAYYPSDATILIYLARAYAWQGNKLQAKKSYQRVLIRNTTNLEASRFIAQ